MTPAAVLFCTTVVTIIPHGSIAQKNCRFVEPPFTLARKLVVETPVQNSASNSVLPPATQASSLPPPAKTVVSPPTLLVTNQRPKIQMAATVAKPVVKLIKTYKPRMGPKVIHQARLHRSVKNIVEPAMIEYPKPREQLNLWEKIKRLRIFN